MSDSSRSTSVSDADSVREPHYISFRDVLSTFIKNPLQMSTFATGGALPPSIGVPAIHVDGVGRIAYPLSAEQSRTIVGAATQAPFGMGTETLVDLSVRRTWQVESSRVRIAPLWLEQSLPLLVSECCQKLGVDAKEENVTANLYKLLLYEEGGHFKRHQDTEKELGMFGSLIVQLPAAHEGGHLVVEHAADVKRFRFDEESADVGYYTAFYADCEHILEPVTSGLRLALAFNLVRGKRSEIVDVPRSGCGVDALLKSAADQWSETKSGVNKLALPLSHAYTHISASFAGLKGRDATVFRLLEGATDPATNEKIFSVYLALVTKYETKTEEELYDDSDASEVVYSTQAWFGPLGLVDTSERFLVDFNKELVVGEGIANAFRGYADREEHGEGYRGNEGGSMQYWYHSAVLVFWPTRRDFEMKLEMNPRAAVSVVQNLVKSDPADGSRFGTLVSCLRKWQNCGFSDDFNPIAVMSLAVTVDDAREVLALFEKHHDSTDSTAAVVSAVSRFGWAPLCDSVMSFFNTRNPPASVSFIAQLAECDNIPAETIPTLKTALLSTILQWRGGQSNEVLAVCRFAISNYSSEDQRDIGDHIGRQSSLPTLNMLIITLPSSNPLLSALRDHALQSCIDDTFKYDFSHAWLVDAVEWMIKGEHFEFVKGVVPKLKSMAKTASLFRKLFSSSTVRDVLEGTPSAITDLLAEIGSARVEVLREAQSTATLSSMARANASELATLETLFPLVRLDALPKPSGEPSPKKARAEECTSKTHK